MEDKQHDTRIERKRNGPVGEGSGEAPDEAAVREARARRLLAAGDDAIRRALSRNSEQFLAHNRQQGGQ